MNHFLRFKRTIGEKFHINSLELIQGKCSQIWEYSMSERDQIRKGYLK